MSNETYTDALEVPAGTLLANYVAKFVGTLIAFLILTAIWGEHLAMSFDAIWRFDTSGLGGADRQWMTMTMYLYELGWGPQVSFGKASAVAWLLFLIIVLIGLLNFAITRRIASGGSAHPTTRRTRGRRG